MEHKGIMKSGKKRGLYCPMDILLVLLIALIIVGPGKLPQLGESLGKSAKAFKKALSGKSDKEANAAAIEEEKKSK